MIFIQLPNETDSQNKMWSTKTHGMITLPIATAGVLLNLMIITIFVQKSMRTHTNNILMSISIFDLLMMLAYIPYTVYFYLVRTPDPYPDQSTFWPYFLLAYNHFSIFMHACSVWMTCYLALYRLITVASCVLHTISNKTFLAQNVKSSIFIIVIAIFLCLIVNILTYELEFTCKQYWFSDIQDQFSIQIGNNVTCKECLPNEKEIIEWNYQNQIGSICANVFWITESRIANNNPIISSINFWIHAIIFRTLPCILMLVLSCLLINIMHKANIKKKSLIQQGKKNEYDKASEFNRTTTMLLIIVILFFIMEFPHGILYIICGFSQPFFYKVYSYYADFLDVIVLLNSSINFFLYCFMSAEFRRKFKETFFFAKPINTTVRSNTLNSNRLNSSKKKKFTHNRKSVFCGFLFKNLNNNNQKNGEFLLDSDQTVCANKTNNLKLQDIVVEND